MCVYKFDYWLDDEDWYEHGYDENRLQNDAYQHLFIGMESKNQSNVFVVV